jgi:hypothetical protein
VFALLVGIGIGTAAFLWIGEQRRAALHVHERGVGARVEGLIATSRDIAASQAAYVALAQPLQPSLDRVAANLQTLAANVSALASTVRSTEATATATQIADNVKSLAEADRTIRENLRAGETLMASDLIFGEARHTIDAIVVSLRELEDVEASWTSTDLQLLDRQAWTTLVGVAALWVLGLIVLVPIPATANTDSAPVADSAVASAETANASPQADTGDSSLRIVPEPAAAWSSREPETAAARPAAASVSSSVDLAAAADVCTAISRVTSVAALNEVLGHAAAVLDATGVIVWLGAGEELFPATAFGYDPRVVSRLGPIARFSDNATANAWLMGQVRTVAGDGTTNGAIVAPMFGPDACIGVLAAEVRHGREADPATQAVTTMIAAQLASAVIAWPAASSAETKAG